MDSGYIVGVNFETPRLIVLSDQPVYEAMYSTGPATASPTSSPTSAAWKTSVVGVASFVVILTMTLASGSGSGIWFY
jgi:hypothetical protein